MNFPKTFLRTHQTHQEIGSWSPVKSKENLTLTISVKKLIVKRSPDITAFFFCKIWVKL